MIVPFLTSRTQTHLGVCGEEDNDLPKNDCGVGGGAGGVAITLTALLNWVIDISFRNIRNNNLKMNDRHIPTTQEMPTIVPWLVRF